MRCCWRDARGLAVFEALLLLTAGGLALACDRRLGFGNPFQIYFLVWLPILVAHYLSRETFVAVPVDYLLLILTAKALALLLLIVVRTRLSDQVNVNRHPYFSIRKDLIAIAQALVCLAAPFAYLRAKELAGGENIFTVVGYITLRSAMTEGGGQIGFLAYFFILSYAVTSLTLLAYKKNAASLSQLMLSSAVSLFYVYVSTGRTHLLLLVSLTLIPLIMLDTVRLRGLLIALSLTGATFVLIATMTAKGISVEAGLLENVMTLAENLRAYTVAPFVAMSGLIEADRPLEWGANTFRFVISILHASGMIETPPPALIREYVFVPDPTNVYTVYDAYFRDFSYLGIFIPPSLLTIHWWLYSRARRAGGKWIFYYAASVYPLATQFFQDQYFSLLSIWIQLAFWFWIFLAPPDKVHEDSQLRYA
jgi:oligosaccharide repeat unit polymerase